MDDIFTDAYNTSEDISSEDIIHKMSSTTEIKALIAAALAEQAAVHNTEMQELRNQLEDVRLNNSTGGERTNRGVDMRDVKDLPKWDGNQTSALAWILSYEKSAQMLRMTDSEKSRFVYKAMEEKGQTWLTAAFEDEVTDWEAFKLRFFKDQLNNKPEEAIKAEIAKKKKENESNVDYCDRIRALYRNLFGITGITTPTVKIVRSIRMGLPKDVALAFTTLTTTESLRAALLEADQRSGQPQRPFRPREDSDQRRKEWDIKGKQSEQNMTCYNCGKRGHGKNNCNLKVDEAKCEKVKAEIQARYKALRSGTTHPARQYCTHDCDDHIGFEVEPEPLSVDDIVSAIVGRQGDSQAGTSNVTTRERGRPGSDDDDFQLSMGAKISRGPDSFSISSVSADEKKVDLHYILNKCDPANQIPKVYLAATPTIQLCCGEFQVKGMVDSGSAITLITPYLARKLGKPWHPWLVSPLILANGDECAPLGVIEVVFFIKKLSIQMVVGIMKGLDYDVLLGNDFNSAADLVVFHGPRHVRIREDLKNFDEILALPTVKGENIVVSRVDSFKTGIPLHPGEPFPRDYEPPKRHLSKIQRKVFEALRNDEVYERVVNKVKSFSEPEDPIKSAILESIGIIPETAVKTRPTQAKTARIGNRESQYSIDCETNISHWENSRRNCVLGTVYSANSSPNERVGTTHCMAVADELLAPKSETLIEAKIQKLSIGLHTIETKPSTRAKGIELADGIIDNKRNTVSLVIRNTNNYFVRIHPRMRLGVVKPLPDEWTDVPVHNDRYPFAYEVWFHWFWYMLSSGLWKHIWVLWLSLAVMFINKNEKWTSPTHPIRVNNVREPDMDYIKHFNIGNTLTTDQKVRAAKMLKRFRKCFAFTDEELGRVDVEVHTIDTGSNKSVSSQPYRTSPQDKKVIEETVNDLLLRGLIRPVQTPWAVPVVLVKGRTGKIRFCCDYRKVNAITKPRSVSVATH